MQMSLKDDIFYKNRRIADKTMRSPGKQYGKHTNEGISEEICKIWNSRRGRYSNQFIFILSLEP